MGRNIIPIISGRTRFGNDIVAEFWMPQKPSRRAIILCDGCPSLPSRHRVGEFFARKGYWVFHPRYRGAWESGGVFLKNSPHEDVLIVAHALNEGFLDIVSRKTYFLDVTTIMVLGASFGGAAAILALTDPVITAAVALSPVIDWRRSGKSEPFDHFVRLITEGFGGAYRADKGAWEKLQSGAFYNPMHAAAHVDSSRLCIIHAVDDDVVPITPLRSFAKKTHCVPHILPEGGHFSVRSVSDREKWRIVGPFLKQWK
jgi:dipeptidyl aminopeptidase/acylaminoacyl peptidase